VRENHTAVEVFVLADSPVVVRRRDGTVAAHCDDRIDHLPGYTPEIVRDHRNAPGGFWVAGSRPEAAYEALTTTIDRDAIEYAGLFSDGASRLVERHGRSWAELLTLLEQEGPAEVLRQVRTADAEAPADPQRHRGKTHDDATAVGCRFPAHCQ
ncbi:MAG: protein phosphatase 2C domain-containing protein, partial [Nocardioidaceae bacterium]